MQENEAKNPKTNPTRPELVLTKITKLCLYVVSTPLSTKILPHLSHLTPPYTPLYPFVSHFTKTQNTHKHTQLSL
jgi:hypothetical protein